MRFIEITDLNGKLHCINVSKIIMFYPRLNGKTVIIIESCPKIITGMVYEEIVKMVQGR